MFGWGRLKKERERAAKVVNSWADAQERELFEHGLKLTLEERACKLYALHLLRNLAVACTLGKAGQVIRSTR